MTRPGPTYLIDRLHETPYPLINRISKLDFSGTSFTAYRESVYTVATKAAMVEMTSLRAFRERAHHFDVGMTHDLFALE